MSKITYIGVKKALEHMSRGAVLSLMHDNSVPGGKSYCVLPGGRVRGEAAASIIKRGDVVSSDDGIFPNTSQTWKLLHFIK